MSGLVAVPYRPKSSFLGGVALIVDFGHALICYESFESEAEADMYALQRDFDRVCQDIREVGGVALAEVNAVLNTPK